MAREVIIITWQRALLSAITSTCTLNKPGCEQVRIINLQELNLVKCESLKFLQWRSCVILAVIQMYVQGWK